MTEKEIFLNMIRRVLAENASGEELENFYHEDGDSVTIINSDLKETIFYFDKNGCLSFYE